jgi:hypothetical protein
VALQCLAEEAFGCRQVTVLAEEEVDGVADAVNGEFQRRSQIVAVEGRRVAEHVEGIEALAGNEAFTA